MSQREIQRGRAGGESGIFRELRALRRRAALDFGGSRAHRDIDRERERAAAAARNGRVVCGAALPI